MSSTVDVTGQLLGPMGGVFALGFSVGAGAAYGFVMRVIVKARIDASVAPLQARLDVMSARIDSMKSELTREKQLIADLTRKLLDLEPKQ